MSMRRYVIIGAGAAGAAASEAIRSRDPAGEILLVSEEAEGYYSRPGLAYYLTGELTEKQLFPFTDADFRRLKIQRLHARAVRIDPDQQQVELHQGMKGERASGAPYAPGRIAYDRLLIATGSNAVRTEVPGINVEGVVKLDNLADARRILALARKARSALVVGGGITALEILEGLLCRGIKPDYFLRGDRYWGNVLDEIESRIIEQRLKEEGVHVHYHTELAEVLSKGGKITGVRTKDGRQLKCDLLAVAIGVQPRVELARASGLRVERGIWVDETLQASRPHIYAAGDVAEAFDPLTGKTVLDTLWAPARDQGRLAGLNMTGAGLTYHKPPPFNVTRLAHLTTTIIGTVGRGRDEDLIGIARGDSETWRQLPDAIAAQSDFEVNRLRVMVAERKQQGAAEMIGAIVMGDQTLSRPLQQMISNRVDVSPIREKLLDPTAPVADVIADFYGQARRSARSGM